MIPLSTREFPFLRAIPVLLFLTVFLLTPVTRTFALDLLDFLPEELYRSSATIRINLPESDRLPGGELNPRRARQVEHIVKLLKSRTVAGNIARELHLDAHLSRLEDFLDLYRRIQDGIEIRKVGPDLYEISAVFTDPEECPKIVNLLIRDFIYELIQREEQAIIEKMEFLEREIVLYRSKEEEFEKRLRDFTTRNILYVSSLQLRDPLDFDTDRSSTLFGQYLKLSLELLDQRKELRALTARERRLEENLKQTERTVVASRETDQRTGEVLRVTTSLNPIYQELDLELTRTREGKLSAEERIEILKTIKEGRMEKIEKIPGLAREYAEMKRDYANISRMLERLLEEREQVLRKRRLRLESRGAEVMIIDNAEVPLEPYTGEKAYHLLPRRPARGDGLLIRSLLKFFFD